MSGVFRDSISSDHRGGRRKNRTITDRSSIAARRQSGGYSQQSHNTAARPVHVPSAPSSAGPATSMAVRLPTGSAEHQNAIPKLFRISIENTS
jgi:hypothetical protein